MKTTREKDIFKMFVGQERPRRKLNYLYSNWLKSNIFPNSMFIAPRGCGKTAFATTLCEAMADHKKDKLFVPKTCSGYKNLDGFMNSVIMQHVHNKECAMLLDECHLLPVDVQTMFLTALAPNSNRRNTYSYEEYEVDFDFRRHTFVFATTEPHKMLMPLMDRLERIDLQEYKPKHLCEIIKKNLVNAKFDDGLLEEIASVLRGNPRQAVRMAEFIRSHLISKKKKKFIQKDWDELSLNLDILPLGLTHNEFKVLESLQGSKGMSLTCLSAKLKMTPDSVRRDLELYLQSLDLMEIRTGAGRLLTREGIEYLDEHGDFINQ
jgi:Holliday junction resolvasome RuvABC ATP-dependent DNA helicase subunit